MLFRVLQTRRASADGVTAQTFLRGVVYDRPEAFVRKHFPDGTYELVSNDAGHTASGADHGSKPGAAPAVPSKGQRRWLRRNGGS